MYMDLGMSTNMAAVIIQSVNSNIGLKILVISHYVNDTSKHMNL